MVFHLHSATSVIINVVKQNIHNNSYPLATGIQLLMLFICTVCGFMDCDQLTWFDYTTTKCHCACRDGYNMDENSTCTGKLFFTRPDYNLISMHARLANFDEASRLLI